MKKLSLIFVAILTASILASCRKQEEKPTGVAVLDLARVASQLGWDKEFQQALQSREQDLGSQLQNMSTRFQEQIQQRATSLASEEDVQSQQELAQMRQKANEILQQALGNAQQQSQQYRAELISDFRDKIRPIAIQVANDKGFAVVMLKTDQVYHHQPETDITDEVLTQAQSVDLKSLTSPKSSDAPAEDGDTAPETTESDAESTEQ